MLLFGATGGGAHPRSPAWHGRLRELVRRALELDMEVVRRSIEELPPQRSESGRRS